MVLYYTLHLNAYKRITFVGAWIQISNRNLEGLLLSFRRRNIFSLTMEEQK